MVWLSADCDTPRFAAAAVKLRSSATATNATESSRVVENQRGRAEHELPIHPYPQFPAVPLELPGIKPVDGQAKIDAAVRGQLLRHSRR